MLYHWNSNMLSGAFMSGDIFVEAESVAEARERVLFNFEDKHLTWHKGDNCKWTEAEKQAHHDEELAKLTIDIQHPPTTHKVIFLYGSD